MTLIRRLMRSGAKYLAGGSVCIVLIARMAAAEDKPFSSTLWRTDTGLPENFVQAIVADGDRALWVATSGGLSHFDGSSFTNLSEENLRGLSVSSFSCLMKVRDGSLWAGTEGGGLVHFVNSTYELFGNSSGLSDQYVRSIFQDSQGKLWVGTDGGLFLKEGKGFRRVHFGAPRSPQDVHDIVEDHHGQIIVGGSQLWEFGPHGSRGFHLPGTDSQSQVKSLLVDRDGVLWVGTLTGLFQRKSEEFVHISPVNSDAMLQAHDGTIWIGTIGTGLLTFRDGKLHSVGDSQGPVRSVLSLCEDQDGRIWVGTEGGLIRLQNTPVELVPIPISGTEFGTISNGPDGSVLVAVQHVFKIVDGRKQRSDIAGLEKAHALNVLYSRDGSAWMGTLAHGVYHVTSTGIEHYSTRSNHPLTGDAPRGLLETENGDLWIATGFGLNRIHDKVVTQYGTTDGLPSRNVRSILEDRSHCLWIGTEAGLAHMCGNSFIHDIATDTLRGEKIWAMLQDRHGTFWFGTRDHGLYRFDGQRMLHLTVADGLLSNSVYSILQDAAGRFWISSPETISSVSEDDMEQIKQGHVKPLAVSFYSMPQGAEGTQLSGGRFPSGLIARDNSVWFASNRGAIHIAREADSPVHIPGAVITSVSADGVSLPIAKDVHLKSTTQRINFGYKPVFLGYQKEIQLMYRLWGLDSNWTVASSAGVAEYRNLPPGEYRFEVRAFLRKWPDQESIETFSFVRDQVWYRTRWFIVLCLILISAIMVSAYMLRLRRLRSRFKLLLEERSRLAREMHDTVIQGCNGVSMLLEAVATKGGPAASDGLLTLARSQIQATITEAREAVWNLRKPELEAAEFNKLLQELVEQASETLGLPVWLEHSGDTFRTDPATAHELLMIAREAISNAGNHGKPNRIQLQTTLVEDTFALAIIDDGRGFETAESMGLQNGHYGLVGMRERAEKIHAMFKISSVPGKGTQVFLEMHQSQLDGTARTLRR